MYRTLVILIHTFRESAVQPIYTLLLALGTAIMFAFRWLPFFTFGEDTIMYKAVCLDVIMLLALLATLFATSRTIFDEIEDRTMLTLMSKPVSKLQVLLGKYLGIILGSAAFIAVLGVVLIACTYMRIPSDYQLSTATVDERELSQISQYRMMHTAGLIPSLVLAWLQVSVLASIGVALSTRFSLVVNLPVVILLYIAGNLVRFLFPISKDPDSLFAESNALTRGLAYWLSALLPYLETFDLRELTIYKKIAVAGDLFSTDPTATPLSTIWGYLGVSTLYAIAYAAFALCIGMWMFQNRELGGAEG